ncbi:transmembrane channel-like protein 8 isoform X5 [Ursus americanus]|uniref:transmembrane channel-like protein 8 isoform X5 n=1 Tax=Ursus americanus TaxID=9643 RepID=UPI001E6798EE|nr:transmembrane channel-like protein 8 isoform X5 [Ursus americanus]
MPISRGGGHPLPASQMSRQAATVISCLPGVSSAGRESGAPRAPPRNLTLRKPGTEMLRQWSVQSRQALVEPEPEPGVEELWEQEMERLWSSQALVREVPYAMVDKRFIRQLREPEGVKTSCWQRWRRRRETARRRLADAAQRLARGFGLWEGALYEIGGLFGTGIQSYFTFLRFLLLLNLLTLLLTASFVLLPLVWLRPPDTGPSLNFTFQCPGGLQSQTGVPRFHNQLWNVLTGRAFTNTYLFYGAYRAGPESSSAYSIRLAYLLSPLACLLLSFCGILRRMVKGLPQRLFLGQDYKSPVSVKVFSSWDFCIRGLEAATIKKHEISNEFKVELEERRRFLLVQQETRTQRVCHLLTYLRVNFLIGLLVVGAISAIFWATKYSQDNKEESLFVLLQYLPPGIIALVNFLGPLLFVFLIQLENYPPNTEVNLALIWCVVLKLASLGMFSFSLGQTVLCIGQNKTSCASYGYNACDYQPLPSLSACLGGCWWSGSRAGSGPGWTGRSSWCPRTSWTLWRGRRSPGWASSTARCCPCSTASSSSSPSTSRSIHSSWDCGLFANYSAPWQVVPELVALRLPPPGQRILHYLGSHAFSFPFLILLSLVLTVCVSQSQANARAIRGFRKQLVWQVQEKWHLVEDLSRLLPEPGSGGSVGPESPHSRASRPRSFCPGFPCPGSPGPRTPRPGACLEDPARPCGAPVPASRFRFPSSSEL